MSDSGYLFSELASITGGKLLLSADARIRELLTDSRKLSTPANTVFFALIARNDGHEFIPGLYRKGLRYFVVSKIPHENYPDISFILVEDTLAALQKLAAFHRTGFNLPVIGITGSNGKTIVKEWLWQLMSPEYIIARSPRSYNSQIGVPLSVWQIDKIHTLGIFEAGISEPGEMNHLAKIIQPSIGIITNIGHAHDQYFDSHQQKAEEKLKLFCNSEIVVFCNDHELIRQTLLKKANPQQQLFSWGFAEGSSLKLISVKTLASRTSISASYNGALREIEIPFTDAASVENAIHCWCIMLLFNYGPAVTLERMRQLHPVEMRLQLNAGINGCSVINDAYSFDPDSLRIALDYLVTQNQHERRTVILSDMLQSGADETELYQTIAQMIHQRGIQRVIGIGETISVHRNLFNQDARFFPDTDTFLNQFPLSGFNNETLLIKGARKFGFERITARLIQKSHETILEVNLDALVHNLNFYRSKLNAGTRLMAMVKAYSYGSGSFEIASTLQFHRADYLAVAYADEGVELRKAGISLPIMVMNPEESGMASLLMHNLEPEVYSFRVLDMLCAAMQRFGFGQTQIGIHLKMDTGMHRLGFPKDDLTLLAERLKNSHNIRVLSVFSHLAGSDDSGFDDFTRMQINEFAETTAFLREQLGYDFLRHILNSAGISRFPEAQFEMVRLGISLYGISSDSAEQSELEVVNSLKTSISQIRKVKQGESVGYNRAWVAGRDSVIATIPIGYADGLDRRLSNGKGHFLVNGKFAAVAGNVCMDMTMLDITGIEACEGDEIIIFGKDLPISKLAEEMQTIPYEILTGISARVKRAYFKE